MSIVPRISRASARFVPTLRQREGDFGEILEHPGLLGQWGYYDPQTGQNTGQLLIPGGFPDAIQPAPRNDLSRYVDPVGKALIDLFPLPTGLYEDGRFNYATSARGTRSMHAKRAASSTPSAMASLAQNTTSGRRLALSRRIAAACPDS